MKRNISTSLLAVILLLGVFLGAASCSKNDSIAETQWKPINIPVKATDWKLVENATETFYEATYNVPELTTFVFDKGAVVAYYKFNENSKTTLPFVKTTVGTDGIPYTETYSCDFNLGNPSTVTFYIEASDAGKYNGNPPAANFQLILIW